MKGVCETCDVAYEAFVQQQQASNRLQLEKQELQCKYQHLQETCAALRESVKSLTEDNQQLLHKCASADATQAKALENEQRALAQLQQCKRKCSDNRMRSEKQARKNILVHKVLQRQKVCSKRKEAHIKKYIVSTLNRQNDKLRINAEKLAEHLREKELLVAQLQSTLATDAAQHAAAMTALREKQRLTMAKISTIESTAKHKCLLNFEKIASNLKQCNYNVLYEHEALKRKLIHLAKLNSDKKKLIEKISYYFTSNITNVYKYDHTKNLSNTL